MFRRTKLGREWDVSRAWEDAHHPSVASLAPNTTAHRARRVSVGVLLGMSALVLLGRAAMLQLWQGRALYGQAETNRLQTVWTDAPRGRMVDSQGVVVADAATAFSLWLQPSFFRETALQPSRVAWLSARFHMPVADVLSSLPTPLGADAVRWRLSLPHTQAVELLAEEDQWSWYRVENGTTRAYLDTPLHSLSHVLGTIGRMNEEEWEVYATRGYRSSEWIGKTGLEAKYESSLRGFSGIAKQEVDVRGNVTRIVESRPPQSGATLVLALDSALQKEIERLAAGVMERMGKKRMAMVALDPRSGAVRALVSLPSFDANELLARPASYAALASDSTHPLFARAISGQYPPGSTFKLAMAVAGLDAGVITEKTTVLSTGGVRVGRFFFPDWKKGGHGTVDVRSAIANSVNTFFYMVGGGLGERSGLGIERMAQAAARFGVGERTGIDVPGEARGFFPSATWKEQTKGEPWYIGDTYHAAIGQGDVLLTPLQVAAMTAAIANGGTRYTPHVVERIVREGSEEILASEAAREPVGTPASVRVVREGMRETVVRGSAKALQAVPMPVAGKTGTAQWQQGKATHAWFTGFAPLTNPELVVTILVEEGGEGSAVSVPLARDVFTWWYANRMVSSGTNASSH